MAAAEARQLQRDQQSNDRSRHRLADAYRMRQHEIALQQFELIGGNVRAREPPEAGARGWVGGTASYRGCARQLRQGSRLRAKSSQ